VAWPLPRPQGQAFLRGKASKKVVLVLRADAFVCLPLPPWSLCPPVAAYLFSPIIHAVGVLRFEAAVQG